jgi:twitching motility protein PilT
MEIESILKKTIDLAGSDLHLKAGQCPYVRINGELKKLDEAAVTPEDLIDAANQLLSFEQKATLEKEKEVDFGFSIPDVARFRANFYFQRGTLAMSFRSVALAPPSIDELNLPGKTKEICSSQRGLILATGTTGSGKTSTLASMVNHINEHEKRNIISIEDPIEYVHSDRNSIISQREVGTDTESFASGLKYVLRQDPDVILIGEIRDRETMAIALMAADTGHLVMSTLHTVDAAETVNRVISFFPPHEAKEVRLLLSSCLRAVLSLRLIPRCDIDGRVPAVEILLATDTIRECIGDPDKTYQIRSTIEAGARQYGMQTFDQSLMGLFKAGSISLEEALKHCTNPVEFELRAQGIEGSTEKAWGNS